MRTDPAPGAQPITSGFSYAPVENSYSTTEHCLPSHRTPIATKVECRILAWDFRTEIVASECSDFIEEFYKQCREYYGRTIKHLGTKQIHHKQVSHYFLREYPLSSVPEMTEWKWYDFHVIAWLDLLANNEKGGSAQVA